MSHVLVIGDVRDDISVVQETRLRAEDDTTSSIRTRPGGSAANVAAWVAHLGVDVAFVGKAGVDGAAKHTRFLEAHGVRAHIATARDAITGTAVISVDPATRIDYEDRGANGFLTLEDVPDQVWDDVAHVHLTGHSFFDERTRPVAQAVVQRAREAGVTTSVDPGCLVQLRQVGADVFLDWITGVTVVMPDLDEGRVLAGKDDPHDVLEVLGRRVGRVMLTMGADGALYGGRGRETFAVPAATCDPIDVTGAGDATVAGYLAARANGASAEEALVAAMEAAAACITRGGARPHLA
ncbi:carbohydrate kinase family protein [Aeromicrobium massiliense]|uniref:carbohydrate kinase family protein n=1 Tax=Aeromicrobium massiliense TaxID=1464554 RepID=UPI00030B407F|nr:PfkB family carbohydrate kinase [Aeromicrobium massiliense]